MEDWYCVESIPLTGGKYSVVEEKVPDLVETRDFLSIPKSKSMVIPEDSVPDLCESTDVSPESTLTKEEANDLRGSYFDTALLGQKLASALFHKVEKSISCPELLHEESDFWRPIG